MLLLLPKHITIFLGLDYKENNELELAAENFLKAIELNFINPEIYINLAEVYELNLKIEKAIESYKKALDLDPSNTQIYLRLGQLYISLENFEKGWEFLEYRIINKNFSDKVFFGGTKWSGKSLEDKTILVTREFGFGDSIQFARYFPVLNSTGAKVIFKSQPSLVKLLKNSDLKADIIDENHMPADLEYNGILPQLSFPYFFQTIWIIFLIQKDICRQIKKNQIFISKNTLIIMISRLALLPGR